jgi:hypothetical protein
MQHPTGGSLEEMILMAEGYMPKPAKRGMKRCFVVALCFFVAGMTVALGWCIYLSGAIGGHEHLVAAATAIRISFPVIFIDWGGPRETTGGISLFLVARPIIANGFLYALVGVVVYSLTRRKRALPLISN